jgi:hypothetical protein
MKLLSRRFFSYGNMKPPLFDRSGEYDECPNIFVAQVVLLTVV